MMAMTGIPKVMTQGENGPAFVALAPRTEKCTGKTPQAPVDQFSPKPANPKRLPNVQSHLRLSQGRRQINTTAHRQSAALPNIKISHMYPNTPRRPMLKSFNLEGSELAGETWKPASRNAPGAPRNTISTTAQFDPEPAFRLKVFVTGPPLILNT
jgi:hypothetical protein